MRKKGLNSVPAKSETENTLYLNYKQMKKLTKSELKRVMGGTDRKEEDGFGCKGIVACHRDAAEGAACTDGTGTENCKCKGTQGDRYCS